MVDSKGEAARQPSLRGSTRKESEKRPPRSASGSNTGYLLALTAMFALCWGWWASMHDISAIAMPPEVVFRAAPDSLVQPYVTVRDISCISHGAGSCLGFLFAWKISSHITKPSFRRATVCALIAISACYCLCLAQGNLAGVFCLQLLFCLAVPSILVRQLGVLFEEARGKLLPCLIVGGMLTAVSKAAMISMVLVFGLAPGSALAYAFVSVVIALAYLPQTFLMSGRVFDDTRHLEEAAAAKRAGQAKQPRQTVGAMLQNGLWTPLVHIVLFGAVFGIIHTFPTGSGHTPELRTLFHLLGVLLACAWALVAFRSGKGEVTLARIWHFATRATFPVIMVGLFLMPLIKTAAYPIPEVLSQLGLTLYAISLLAAVAMVSRSTQRSPFVIVALCLFVFYLGRTVGLLGPLLIHGAMPFDSVSFSVVSAVSFLLLVAAMFEIPIMTNMKTFWGLEKKTTPRGHYDEVLRRRCAEIASESELTKREQEILFRLLQGQRPQAIADDLVISINTTRTHIQRIYAKTGVHSEGELLALAKRHG